MSGLTKSLRTCIAALVATCAVSAHGQIISTIVGNGLDGKKATDVSVQAVTVARDRADNLYVATQTQVYRIDPGGTLVLVAGSGSRNYAGDGGPAVNAGLGSSADIAIDTSGNLYIADPGNSVIRRVDGSSGIISTVAGTGSKGYSGDGGPATSAQLSGPAGLALDSSGNLYISDSGNNVIRKVDASSRIISTVVSGLTAPEGITVDTHGNLFIANTGRVVILKRDASTGKVTTVAGNGTQLRCPYSFEACSGSSSDGGPATSAQLGWPSDVAVDSLGNIYIADEGYQVNISIDVQGIGGNAIRKVDGTSGIISTIAGNGQFGSSGDGGPATSAQLNYPESVVLDNYGNLYIADSGNVVIRKVDVSTGVISRVAGNGHRSFSGDGESALQAQIDGPQDVAVDRAGNLYIADTGNKRVRKVNALTGTISTVAGTGEWGPSGNGGPATSASVYPLAVAVDSFGNLYIAEFQTVRKVDAATGLISTFAGNGQSGDSGDGGPATAAELLADDLALDSSGNLYIEDGRACRIRRVDATTGIITTVAGNGTCIPIPNADGSAPPNGDGGPAQNAELYYPVGIALDSMGNLYIAEGGIREVSLNAADTANYGIINTVWPGQSGCSASTDRVWPLFVDYAGAIFVARQGCSSDIYKISGIDFTSIWSAVATGVAGNGTAGFSGDGGIATAAQLDLYPHSGITGDQHGNLIIADDGNNRIRSVSGLVTPPDYLLSTTTLTFDPQIIGQGNTQTKPVFVFNTRKDALTIASISISGSNAANFSESDSCIGVPIAQASSCKIEVTFAAAIAGSETALLTMTFANLMGTRAVSLNGAGIALSDSTFSASELRFDTQLLPSGYSSAKSLAITNTGQNPLIVSAIAVGGTNAADFAQSNTCTGSAIAVGSTCTVNVAFTATVAGSESASLLIASNVPASPQSVPLSGAGISFAAPEPAPGGSASSTVSAGSTATFSLQLIATGGATSTDSVALSLTCSGAPITTSCAVPASVTASVGTPGAFTLKVTTTARTTASIQDLNPGGLTISLIPLGFLFMRWTRKRKSLGSVLLLGVVISVISSGGCGGKKNNESPNPGGTPAGTYHLTVKATSGAISRSTTLTLIVQ